VHISSKSDYGIRAMLELASAYEVDPDELVRGEYIASAQSIPAKFLEGILRQLRLAGLVASRRGVEGGYRLDCDPSKVTIADIIRVLDGPLADVHGIRPEDVVYEGASEHLRDVWVAVRASLRDVLERTTLRDVLIGKLPRETRRLLDRPDAWTRR